MTTLIYSDNVSNNHILYYALGRLRGKSNVFFVNANEILAGALDQNVDLLVMPGGASRYKSDKLNGEGYQRISEYVANGGKYLGICGGAYLACKRTEWAKGTPFEIITPNELAFFSGTARGPIEQFALADNYNATEARIVQLETEKQVFESMYLGGCFFEANNETKGNYEVVARFSELPDKPAAIVKGEFGDGEYVLCSTHPEYDADTTQLMQFDVIGNDYQDFNTLKNTDTLTLELLDILLSDG